jgi:two-component system OmpR family sensor kinase
MMIRRKLFWKIFTGFWVTFICIVESVWLLFNVIHPLPSETTRALASISLSAANAAIERGGIAELRHEFSRWPQDDRGAVDAQPWTDRSVIQTDIESGAVSIRARDPQGKLYQLTYRVRRHLGYGRGPFDIPREIVVLTLMGGLAYSAFLAWYLTKLIGLLSRGFNRLANDDFSARLGPFVGRRRDELADLTRDFDKVAEHLQELVAARDRLLSDVSHELRTPLTRLQLAIGIARQSPEKLEPALARISREAAHLDEMVDELLTLSKLESRYSPNVEYYDLSEIAVSVADDAAFEANAKGVAVVCRVSDDSSLWLGAGSGKLIRRAVENVVRNALRISQRGQTVEIVLSHRDAERFRLDILDSGPGVAKTLMPSFFEPFALRSAAKTHGFGLGLSIARRAILANKGAISADNRAAGGLVVSIELPKAAASELSSVL